MKTSINEVLSRQYTLVSFIGNKAGVTRTDKSATAEVLAQKGARASAGRMIKNLYADADMEIRAVFSVIDAARTAHYSMTSPYNNGADNKGPRLIANIMLMPTDEGNVDGLPPHKGYLTTMAEYARELKQKLGELEKVYDRRVAEAMSNLGGMAEASDYPSFQEFSAQCGIHYAFNPVPASSDWERTNLGQVSQKVHDWVKERTETQCETAAKEAVKDAVQRMIDPLQRMIAQTAPIEEGQKNRRIYDSLVGNLQDVVRNLKAFNIYDDPEIEEVRLRIFIELTRYTPEQIKASENVKAELHGKAKDILDTVNSMGWLK